MISDLLKWTKCCKGRASCPEIALEGDKIRIKDDYGNQVVVDKNSFPFFQEPEDISGNGLQIHGEDSNKPPVRMTLEQFYELVAVLDDLENK